MIRRALLVLEVAPASGLMLPLIEQLGSRRSSGWATPRLVRALVETGSAVLVEHAGDVGEDAGGALLAVIRVPAGCWRSVGSVERPGDVRGFGWGGG